VKRAILVLALLAIVAAAAFWLRTLTAPLATIERGGSGPPTLVMLHGYGSRAEDWLQFEDAWQLPANTRRVFPQAPLRGPLTGQRGWWWLNIEGHIPKGELLPDYTHASPGGIKVASRMVRALLAGQQSPIILGGFSQGAMVSGEIAFQSDQDLAGLILLSGTVVDEEKWAEHFAGRRHLPIFIAHGRFDAVLPFSIMERFQARLKAFGLNVTWMPFEGEHEIPEAVILAASDFARHAVELQFAAGRH
jgi:phospholipase/carboxylesterase